MSNRTTKAKTAITDLILKSSHALSHQDILQATNNICNRVTIYRILDKLVENGIAHRIVDLDGVSRYAACNGCVSDVQHNHNHIHFSCTKCMNVTCLEGVKPQFQLPEHYIIQDVNFTISGLCPACV